MITEPQCGESGVCCTRWFCVADSIPEHSPMSSESSTHDEANIDESIRSQVTEPLRVTYPIGSYCPAQPTLDDVLHDTAPWPYKLGAFRTYITQNYCAETLEFLMEANRYRESYHNVSHQLDELTPCTNSMQIHDLCMLWRRLVSTYIVPGSPCEINLPSEARDGLFQFADATTPPPPETLDPAVRRMCNLMEESIFIPFLISRASSYSVIQGSSTNTGSCSPILTDDPGSMPLRSVADTPVSPFTPTPFSDLNLQTNDNLKSRTKLTWKKIRFKFGFKKKVWR